jgi:hypothetical protein
MLGFSGDTAAHRLGPPEGLVCEYDGFDSVTADWFDLTGATGYALEVTAKYDISGDGSADRTQEFDFEASDSDLSIGLHELEAIFYDDATNTVVSETPISARLRVKGLHLGGGDDEDDSDDARGHEERGDDDGDEQVEDDDDWDDDREDNAYGDHGQNPSSSQYCEVTIEGTACPFGRCP